MNPFPSSRPACHVSRGEEALIFFFALALLLAPNLRAQAPAISGRLKDFQAPVTEDSGRKAVIKGKDAAPMGNGLFRITAPHVDMYKADNTVDMMLDADECEFANDQSKDVWSDKAMSVKTTDGRMSIKGRGFRYKPNQSLLSISNNVEAVIRRQALVDPKAPNPTNNSSLKVTSDWLEHHVDSVTFGGHVIVVDQQGELHCETLKVRFGENNSLQLIDAIDEVVLIQKETEAHGRKANYNPLSGLLRLSEQTTWKMGERSGSSDLLILDRTNNTLRAEGSVKMQLPSNFLATNAPTKTNIASTNFTTIAADTFDFAQTNTISHGPIAIFNGNVHAVDPQAKLDCELLTIFFDRSNHLARAVADRAVKIVRTDGMIEGQRARFENEEITVTGEPKWKLQDKSGTSDVVVFNPRTREVRAAKVRMEAPTSGATNILFAAGPTKTNSTPGVMVITSETFTNKDNLATFAGKVRASEPRGQIDANTLSVYFNKTNRAERVVANGDVILTQDRGQAIGQNADYDLTTGLIHLTGEPEVFEQDRRIIAKEFIYDKNTSKAKALPPYRVLMKRKPQTNEAKTSIGP